MNYYVIERSYDGRTFTPVGQLLPLLNNGSRVNYSFEDTSRVNSSTIFYRIKGVELNGTSLYSAVLPIATTMKNASFKIYPNPVLHGLLSFEHADLPKGRYTITIINAVGQSRLIKTVEHQGGSLSQTLSLLPAPAGIYSLHLQSAKFQFSKKIIIQ